MAASGRTTRSRRPGSGKVDAAAAIPAPCIAETKAIAEEAFIYGLPIVMNYAVMNEFVVDKNSGQYKAPFNTISNEARVFTYKDTAVVTPNGDTPYSMLWLDLRAEPMVVSVPAVPRERYYSMQPTDGNACNYGYIGTRATGTERADLPGDAPVLAEGCGAVDPAGWRGDLAATWHRHGEMARQSGSFGDLALTGLRPCSRFCSGTDQPPPFRGGDCAISRDYSGRAFGVGDSAADRLISSETRLLEASRD